MFGLSGKKKVVLSTLTFDEAYSHSAGLERPSTYRIAKGTTDLRFVFPDFEAFWQIYINRNPHLSEATLVAMQNDQALFATAVVEGGEYRYYDGVDRDDAMLLNAGSLLAFGHDKPFRVFGKGAIAFGIYHTGVYRFEVLWATIYETA